MNKNKIIIVAHDLDPDMGSEGVISHNMLVILSKYFSVEVFVDGIHKNAIETFNYGDSVNFHYIELNDKLTKYYKRFRFFNLVYKNFINKLKPELINLINKEKISLIHYLTPASIHSSNTLYREINVPYIIGPLGGGLMTPKGFNEIFSNNEVIKNILRDTFYHFRKKNRKLVGYFLHSSKILIGTDYLNEYLPGSVQGKVQIFFDTFVDLKNDKNPLIYRKRDYVQIVFIGRLSGIKGILMLIEAIREIKLKREDVLPIIKVLVVGDGPQRKRAERAIKKYDLSDTITLKGRVKMLKVLEYLKESDIFCIPTIREHGGQAILEAMASGLPVITSNYGGPKYSVTEQCGIRIEVINFKQYVHDLAEAIVKLVSDDFTRKQMGVNAKKRVEQEFSLQAVEHKILNIYNEVIRENREEALK